MSLTADGLGRFHPSRLLAEQELSLMINEDEVIESGHS